MVKSSYAVVRGIVQGVGFRYSALNKARSLGLKGWVRNETDGSVTTRFEGSSELVETYINWLRKGPSSSTVRELIVNEMEPDDSLEIFHVEF